MRLFLKGLRKRQSRTLADNYYWQLCFRYHAIFFGSLVFSGKKLKAFKIFALVKQGLKIKESANPYRIFLVSLMMVTPNIHLFPLKLGGRAVGVPLAISEKKKVALGVRLIIKLLKEHMLSLSVNAMVDLLSSSIYGKGIAYERKLALYKNGSRNRHLLSKLFKKIKKKRGAETL